MNWKRMLISGTLGAAVLIGSIGVGSAQETIHKVQSGDTFWIISQKYNVNIYELMKVNQANENTVLYPGQVLTLPVSTNDTIHTVKSGETYWIISQKYGVDINKLMDHNNADANTIIYIGQQIKIPSDSSTPSANTVQSSTKPYVTYITHKVVKGDDVWKLSLQYGIPMYEILSANNMNENSWLNIGDTLKIPVHHVPVKSTPGEKYGEYLDWWTEAQYVLPIGAEFKVTDFQTGLSFMVKRTTGSNHADSETLTADDTKTMLKIWGGSFSWDRRPVVIEYKGRKIAASVSGMPHAGNDKGPGGQYTSWRSGNYGAGTNFDWVKNNGMDGHFDIHFLNSTKHKDGEIDSQHQANVKTAAGIK